MSESFVQNARDSDRPVAQPYLLALAGPDPRKNTDVIIDAWTSISDEVLDWVLVLVRGPESPLFQSPAMPLGERIVWIDNVPDSQLAALYAHAHALVYVSSYEGFGLPPLEAAASGTSFLIASDLPPLRQSLGEGATFVKPRDREGLAEAMRRVVRSDAPHSPSTVPTWRSAAAEYDALFQANS